MEHDQEISIDPREFLMPKDSLTKLVQQPKVHIIENYVVPPTMQFRMSKEHEKMHPITLQNNGLGLDYEPQLELPRPLCLADLIEFNRNAMEVANPFALAKEAHRALERHMMSKAEFPDT